MRADAAEMDLNIRITLNQTADGASSATVDSHNLPVRVYRQWTAGELRQDPSLENDPWHDGGAAIVGVKHASNGHQMASKLQDMSDELMTGIRQAVSKIVKP